MRQSDVIRMVVLEVGGSRQLFQLRDTRSRWVNTRHRRARPRPARDSEDDKVEALEAGADD
jgi:hypothetical protein